MELIDIGELRKEKSFLKLQKRILKEREEMRRRHQKMRGSMQKAQQITVDKLVAGQQSGPNKLSLRRRNHLNNISSDVATHPSNRKEDSITQSNKTRHLSLGNRISDPAYNGEQQVNLNMNRGKEKNKSAHHTCLLIPIISDSIACTKSNR